VLPATVVSPGVPMGRVSPDMAKRWPPGFLSSTSTMVVGGTTDSNAAFFAAAMAAGSQQQQQQPSLGTAVTSLGSTLALKQLSKTYVEDASLGVYSHRFPSVFKLQSNSAEGSSSLGDAKGDIEEEAWLVGGASNVGCAVLRQEGFSNPELDELSQDIDPNTDSPLQYYPLTNKKGGERFPVADSNKEAILTPVPDNRRDYLHGILQGISNVERDGYLALGKLGASPKQPTRIWTSGGGSRNDMWNQMRQRRLREAFQNRDNDDDSSGSREGDRNAVVVAKANNVEASYGAAILAAASFVKSQ
jgi:D-ribulokinase